MLRFREQFERKKQKQFKKHYISYRELSAAIRDEPRGDGLVTPSVSAAHPNSDQWSTNRSDQTDEAASSRVTLLPLETPLKSGNRGSFFNRRNNALPFKMFMLGEIEKVELFYAAEFEKHKIRSVHVLDALQRKHDALELAVGLEIDDYTHARKSNLVEEVEDFEEDDPLVFEELDFEQKELLLSEAKDDENEIEDITDLRVVKSPALSFSRSPPLSNARSPALSNARRAGGTPLLKRQLSRRERAEGERETGDVRSTYALKQSLSDEYNRLMDLQSFATLNLTGFTRLLKKYERRTRLPVDEFVTKIKAMSFAHQTELRELSQKIESEFAKFFCDGHLVIARARLLDKMDDKFKFWTFHLGMKVGSMCLVLIWIISAVLYDDPSAHKRRDMHWVETIFPVYRGIGCLILLGWCWGFNCFIWHKYKINYVLIFGLHPHKHRGYRDTFEHCTNLTLILFTNFLIFFKQLTGDIPDVVSYRLFPGLLYCSFIIYLAIYFRPFQSSPTYLFAKAFQETVCAPFYKITFLAGYVGDVLTSLVKVYIDVWFGLCWTLSGVWLHNKEENVSTDTCLDAWYVRDILSPLFSALPLWFRLMQCIRQFKDSGQRWPYLGNAGKYAVSQCVVLFGVFHSAKMTYYGSEWLAYLLCMIVSTAYSYSWDLFMDWDLMKPKYAYLRKRLMYKNSEYVYYLAIFLDAFGRFAWTFTLIPAGRNSPLSSHVMQYVTPCLAALEIMRRTMWGCFRLENEHLHKTQQYEELPFHPFHFDSAPTGVNDTPSLNGTRVLLETTFVIAVVVFFSLLAAFTR